MVTEYHFEKNKYLLLFAYSNPLILIYLQIMPQCFYTENACLKFVGSEHLFVPLCTTRVPLSRALGLKYLYQAVASSITYILQFGVHSTSIIYDFGIESQKRKLMVSADFLSLNGKLHILTMIWIINKNLIVTLKK